MKTNLVVLVSGPSGSGKTKLVNMIIELDPSLYERPKAYTSRSQRENEGNDEYIFCEQKDILQLYRKGALFNLDFLYGNYYGISKYAMEECRKKKKIIIKEIHPDKFSVFENNSQYHVLKILLLGGTIRKDRYKIDIEYYREVDIKRFDIFIYCFNDKELLNAAIYINRKIQDLEHEKVNFQKCIYHKKYK